LILPFKAANAKIIIRVEIVFDVTLSQFIADLEFFDNFQRCNAVIDDWFAALKSP